MRFLLRCTLTAALCVAFQQAEAAERIYLRNSMASPILVRMTSAKTGKTFKIKLLQNQNHPFDFASEVFDVEISPVDRLDTTFGLGPINFSNMAKRLGNEPMTLRGDFGYVYGPQDGCLRMPRVGVYTDIPLPCGFERISAYLPLDASTIDGLGLENSEVLITSYNYVQLVQVPLVFR